MDIDAHRANTEVSIDQHVERRVVALGRSLDDRTAIYLDTNFWIILRECAAGKRTDPAALELVHRLRTLVAEGKVFCPVSESHLLEFLKQDDMKSRLETARMVDELSLGVALLEHRMRMGTEVAHFVHAFKGDADDLHPLRHLVWSKLGYVLGFVHPSETGFDAETELAIQKAFFDQMWTTSFEEMFKTIGTGSPPDGLNFDTSRLNQGVVQNADQIRSFAQAYAAELGGAVELGAEIAMEVTGYLYNKKTGGQPPQRGSPEWQKFWNQWANLLLVALKKRTQVRQQLRTLHNRMGPTFSSKNGVRYRFYISTALRGRTQRAGSVSRISAPEIESLVEAEVRSKLNADGTTVEKLFERIQRVTVLASQIRIALGGRNTNKRPIEIPWTPKPKGHAEIKRVPSGMETDPKLLKAIVRAQAWLNQLSAGHHTSIENLAAAAGYNPKVVRQGLRLAFLAPELAAAALDDETPIRLRQIPKLLPLSWREQRQSID
jgi:hypothetical protein